MARPKKPEEPHLRLPFWLPWLRWIDPATILATALTLIVIYAVLVAAAGNGIYQHDADTKADQFIEHYFPYPAGISGGEIIPLSRVRLQTAALMVYDAQNKQAISRPETEQIVTNQIADRILYRQALAKQNIYVTDADVNSQMTQISKSIGGQAKLVAFLNQQYGASMTLQRFQDWIVSDSLAEAAVEQQLLVRSTVSHILIAVPANATPAQVEAARQQALTIKSSITNPNQFAAAAKQYSDDVASRDNGGALGTTIPGSSNSYGVDFEKAIFSLPVNQVSDPIRSSYGWHLILVTARVGTVNESLDQYTTQLRQAGHTDIFLKSS